MMAAVHPTGAHQSGRAQQGASLIEVLVAILLVALGILAMGAMQLNATRIAKTSEFRAMGALLAADLADRMRANPQGVIFRANAGDAAVNQYRFEVEYPYDGKIEVPAAAKACDAPDVTCTAAELAAYDMATWRQSVAASLPGGWARVSNVDTTKTGTNVEENAVDVWLMWVDVDNAPASLDDNAACPANAVAGVPDDKKDTVKAIVPRCMYFRVSL